MFNDKNLNKPHYLVSITKWGKSSDIKEYLTGQPFYIDKIQCYNQTGLGGKFFKIISKKFDRCFLYPKETPRPCLTIPLQEIYQVSPNP